MLVVLIWSYNAADMTVTVRLRLGAARPEPARLKEDLGTSPQEEFFVSGCLPVLPDCVRNVRSNVLFLLAAEDFNNATIGTDNPLRCCLRTSVGQFPSVHGPAPTHAGRLRPCPINGPKSVHQQRAGRLWPSQCVERQQIDLGVPENMPMIIISRQPTRSDGDVLVRRVNGAIQMIGSETQRQLCGPGSPRTSKSLRCHRSDQAASCSWTSLRQPSCRAPSNFSHATRSGASSWLSPRATATSRDRHTIWPVRVFQCQDHTNGPDMVGASSEPSICRQSAAAIARRLFEFLVRQTPRSCSSRSDKSPRPSPSNDASRVTPTSPYSTSKLITCSPSARSFSDTSPMVRTWTAMFGWSLKRHPVNNAPRRISRVVRCEGTSAGWCTSGTPLGMMRYSSQPGAGTSTGMGCSGPGISNRPAMYVQCGQCALSDGFKLVGRRCPRAFCALPPTRWPRASFTSLW